MRVSTIQHRARFFRGAALGRILYGAALFVTLVKTLGELLESTCAIEKFPPTSRSGASISMNLNAAGFTPHSLFLEIRKIPVSAKKLGRKVIFRSWFTKAEFLT
jgi:hypothetical protein